MPTPIEQLRNMADTLSREHKPILDQLPNIQALFDYYHLQQEYGTELLAGIHQCIQDGANPQPLINFCERYNVKLLPDDITPPTCEICNNPATTIICDVMIDIDLAGNRRISHQTQHSLCEEHDRGPQVITHNIPVFFQ